MRILVDTHIALWALFDTSKLPEPARSILENPTNEIFYSTASVWELCIKNAARPDLHIADGELFAKCCEAAGFRNLPVLNEHVFLLKTLRRPAGSPRHNDPFDRILLSQAKAENIQFMTCDGCIPDYNEPCVLKI